MTITKARLEKCFEQPGNRQLEKPTGASSRSARKLCSLIAGGLLSLKFIFRGLKIMLDIIRESVYNIINLRNEEYRFRRIK